MKLKYKPARFRLIKLLMGFVISKAQADMFALPSFPYKKEIQIDKWGNNDANPSFNRVELLAAALNIPVGFFYYANIDVSILFDNSTVYTIDIFIADINKQFSFPLPV